MAKRTIENCSLKKKYGKTMTETDKDGEEKCLGFSLWNDDEPIDICKKCKLHNMYEKE